MPEPSPKIYSYNLFDIPNPLRSGKLRKSKSGYIALDTSTAQRYSIGGSSNSSIKRMPKVFKKVRFQIPAQLIERYEGDADFQAVLQRIFRFLTRDYIPDGGHYRNSRFEDAYNFRLVCKAFRQASTPHFDQTFFATRQGIVGIKGLHQILQISKSIFAIHVKSLVLNLFPTSWRPAYAPYSAQDDEKLHRTIATYWDETNYVSWAADIANENFEESTTSLLSEILSNLPNLKGICISTYTFNEFFSCSRKNYLALASMKAATSSFQEEPTEIAIKHIAKDSIGFHQLLHTWNSMLESCFRALQSTRPSQLTSFKLRVPQDLWRYGTPSFPRDVYLKYRTAEAETEPWFKSLKNLSICILVSESVLPKQIGHLEHTSDRWVSRFLYGMESLSSLTITSTDAEMLTPRQRSSIFNRSLVLYHRPTLPCSGIEPDQEHIFSYRDSPPWAWPSFSGLSTITLADIQLSSDGACAFLEANKSSLKTLRFDGKVHMYSVCEGCDWPYFLLQAAGECDSLEICFTRRTSLLSWLWVRDGWRGTETYDPNSWIHTANWAEVFSKATKRMIVREDVLSEIDFHERLPGQLNPFVAVPRFEAWSMRAGDGSLLTSKGLVIRDAMVDGVIPLQGKKVKEEKSMVEKISSKLRGLTKR
jgi:hypothetical protein